MSISEKRGAEQRGRAAESVAAWLLRFKGYRIIARRAKTPVGEIDLIVRRGNLVAAVEVKARADITQAAESLSPRQRQRIAQAFDYWLAHKPGLAGLDRRFDLIVAAPRRQPRHLVDAWRPTD